MLLRNEHDICFRKVDVDAIEMTPLIQTAELSLVASYQYSQIVTGFVASCVICKEICTEIWVSIEQIINKTIKKKNFETMRKI
jgi:hypothetical protein